MRRVCGDWFGSKGDYYPPGGIGRDRGASGIPLGGRTSMKRYYPTSAFINSIPLYLRGGVTFPTPGGRAPATADTFKRLFLLSISLARYFLLPL